MITYWDDTSTEDPATQLRRRLQQRRCLVCGSRRLVNQQISYFCADHFPTHRYCRRCERLRPREEHGADSLCRRCASQRALAYHNANVDRTLYRIRLKQIHMRRHSRAELIMRQLRVQIALADLVARTPGWTWAERAALVADRSASGLAQAYRRQCLLWAEGDAG